MPAALQHEQVRAALTRLGVATVTIIGTGSAKEQLRAEEVTEAEATALADDVDLLAAVLTSGRR